MNANDGDVVISSIVETIELAIPPDRSSISYLSQYWSRILAGYNINVFRVLLF